MVAEIICVGTEILMGNITNTNARYIAENLAILGISNYYQTVVGDNEARLTETLKLALSRADIVILNGGLGPTEDDLTKEVAAACVGKQMYLDERAWDEIKVYFEKRGLTLTDNNKKQAMIPEGAIIMYNPNGTAPGVIIEDNGKSIILLPGPPLEMIPMFDDQVKPYLESKSQRAIYSTMVKMCGTGESIVATEIDDLIHSDNPTVATYAKTGEVHVRVTGSAETEKDAKKLVKPVVKELKARFGANIYTTEENVTLEDSVVELLATNDLTVSTAESCTGGLLAGRIINVAGASEIIKEGIVTYSNKAKRRRLGVKKSTLEKYGAVSEQTAKEMVKGVLSLTKSDTALAVTGIAGPDGGTDEKPVGLVYIACSVCGQVKVNKYQFRGSRQKIRESATTQALTLLRMCILEHLSQTLLK